MTQEAKNIALGLGVVVVLFIASCELRAQTKAPRYYDEQLLNYRYSEFCSVVGKPPAALAEAINNAITIDPKTWLPIAEWWNRIHAKYKEAGCGEA